MSDAQTDIEHDRVRGQCFELFFEALALYLGSPTSENLVGLKARAKAVDDILRGFFSGRTDIVSALTPEYLKALQNKQGAAWNTLLQGCKGSSAYKKLVALSPFVN